MVASAVQVAKRALLATMRAVAVALGVAMACSEVGCLGKVLGGGWGR